MNFLYLISKLIKKLHIPAIKNSIIDKTARVCSGSHVVNVTLGKYSYIGNFCTIVDTKIGSFCSIADNCIIGGASHPIDWVSTSPVFHKGRNVMKSNFSNHTYKIFTDTIIGNDVWIGSNCLIKGGIKIGDGAIIGMGSVVTKDIQPYTIVAGNPAKLIRRRFDDEITNAISQMSWWNWDEREILNKAQYFNDIDLLVSKNK